MKFLDPPIQEARFDLRDARSQGGELGVQRNSEIRAWVVRLLAEKLPICRMRRSEPGQIEK